MSAAGLRIEVEGPPARRVGRITLDRPQALNALAYEGVGEIARALDAWEADPGVALVLIEGAGERAFCAGGDIQEIYRRGRAGDVAHARRFWVEEYRLNARIRRYPKPYVAMMDGVVMGGGVGLSAHGALRLVTERSKVAMPEAAIGLLPDAGGLWLLSRAPGRLGEYLAMTGARMSGADAIEAGFADRFLPGAARAAATAALIETGEIAALEPWLTTPPPSALAALRPLIDRVFALETALEIRAALESLAGDAEAPADARAFAAATLGEIAACAPLSVAAALAAVRRARGCAQFEQALALELRFTWRAVEEGDFLEGIRAMVIDKDRKPVWRPNRLEAVTPARVEAMLAPLGPDELSF